NWAVSDADARPAMGSATAKDSWKRLQPSRGAAASVSQKDSPISEKMNAKPAAKVSHTAGRSAARQTAPRYDAGRRAARAGGSSMSSAIAAAARPAATG